MRAEIAAEMAVGGNELLADMEANAPRNRSGRLRRGLRMVLSPKLLRLRVGIVGKAINRDLFYGRILNFGRKAQTVRVYRTGRNIKPVGKGSDGRPYYLMKVTALKAKRFVIRPRPELWKSFNARLSAKWNSVLKRAAGG